MNTRYVTWFVSSLCLFLSSVGNAAIISASDVVDDATLTLTIEDTLFEGVNQQWGTVQIGIVDVEVAFTLGDSVEVSVFEDDVLGDDLLFQESFFVTAAEVANGLVDRTFLLIFTPVSDGDGGLEIYATALVDKDQCVLFCFFDNPQTANLNVILTAAPVPVPAAAWLFGSALGLLGWMRRRAA